MSSQHGYVYLLHFEKAHEHAQHYLGATANLFQRLTDHATGFGSRLTQVFFENGIEFQLARLWQCNRGSQWYWESQMKTVTRNPSVYCPLCKHDMARKTPRIQDFPLDLFPHPITSTELRHEIQNDK